MPGSDEMNERCHCRLIQLILCHLLVVKVFLHWFCLILSLILYDGCFEFIDFQFPVGPDDFVFAGKLSGVEPSAGDAQLTKGRKTILGNRSLTNRQIWFLDS